MQKLFCEAFESELKKNIHPLYNQSFFLQNHSFQTLLLSKTNIECCPCFVCNCKQHILIISEKSALVDGRTDGRTSRQTDKRQTARRTDSKKRANTQIYSHYNNIDTEAEQCNVVNP